MNKIIGLCLATVLATSSFFATAETFKRLDLDDKRTSVQYAKPIMAVTEVIEGKRWLGQTPEMNGGVMFEAYHNPDFGKDNTETGEGIMVKAIFYTYDKVSKEEIMIARQSKIAGFVELYGYNSIDLQMHIRVLDDDTFQAFSSVEDYQSANELFTYKKVEQFNKSPYKNRLKSSRESGVFH
jgi:hypothetical protein